MFGLDPFNPAVAVAEMLLLLAFAALVGWLLGRLMLSSRVGTLQASIGRKQDELDECRRMKSVGVGAPVVSDLSPAKPPTPDYENTRSGLVAQMPEYVPADPLLPAIAQDDTPALITVSPLPPVPVNMARTEVTGMDMPSMDMPTILPPVAAPVVPVPSAMNAPAVGNSEAAVLNRIAARANELNFDRIGLATAAEADDLKDIVGVGPFLERKLHSLGIYTFRQVANFTREDVAKVNDIIEFFPGRIERDNWVEQSSVFQERKYGRSQ